MEFLNAIDYGLYPLNADKIAAICNVSRRTAQRWIYGETKCKKAFVELINLHQRGKIMPKKWPDGWHFNTHGYLDVGHSKALGWQQLDWYFYSAQCWYHLLDYLPEIEARLDALISTSTTAVIIDLQKYKDELQALKQRPFTLPANFHELYEVGKPERHRKTGC